MFNLDPPEGMGTLGNNRGSAYVGQWQVVYLAEKTGIVKTAFMEVSGCRSCGQNCDYYRG